MLSWINQKTHLCSSMILWHLFHGSHMKNESAGHWSSTLEQLPHEKRSRFAQEQFGTICQTWTDSRKEKIWQKIYQSEHKLLQVEKEAMISRNVWQHKSTMSDAYRTYVCTCHHKICHACIDTPISAYITCVCRMHISTSITSGHPSIVFGKQVAAVGLSSRNLSMRSWTGFPLPKYHRSLAVPVGLLGVGSMAS